MAMIFRVLPFKMDVAWCTWLY